MNSLIKTAQFTEDLNSWNVKVYYLGNLLKYPMFVIYELLEAYHISILAICFQVHCTWLTLVVRGMNFNDNQHLRSTNFLIENPPKLSRLYLKQIRMCQENVNSDYKGVPFRSNTNWKTSKFRYNFQSWLYHIDTKIVWNI